MRFITNKAKLLPAVPLLLLASVSASKVAAKCTVSIDSPRGGEAVGAQRDVSGTASVPPGKYLWVLAHKRGLGKWWPQGSGPALIEPDGKWTASVTYGEDRDNGPFEVTAAIFEQGANTTLLKWVSTAEKTGRYPPLALPTIAARCTSASVTVNKAQ